MKGTALLLSIKPRFADAIFDGTKAVELRRVRPRLNPGDLVLVYVSSPRCRLEGAFLVDSVVEATPNDLWKAVGHESGLTGDEFFHYYTGAKTGFGIKVKDSWILPSPIELAVLKEANIVPPQSYRYLSRTDTAKLGKPTNKALIRA